jgi:meso-butanediol dehydrogenase/(S,S)-butanediol dehydrogenase/diacetyl reductase
VNISSEQAYKPVPRNALYATAKGGVLTLSREMAIDFIADEIRVNCVCPGAVYTGMTAQLLAREGKTRAGIEDRFDRRRLGRMGEAVELARAIVFLYSDDASFAVGGTCVFDGGAQLSRG